MYHNSGSYHPHLFDDISGEIVRRPIGRNTFSERSGEFLRLPIGR